MTIYKKIKEPRDLSEQEFAEILLTIMVGTFIRSAVAEARGEEWQKIEHQVDYFLNLAGKYGHSDLVEKFMTDTIPNKKLCKGEEKIIEEYNEDEFWEQLEIRLGQRDLYRNLSQNELKEIKNKTGRLPEKVHKYYEKYRKEFEKYGLSRIKISDEQ